MSQSYMMRDGNRNGLEDESFIEVEGDQQNFTVQRSERGKSFMEMEGRGYSDLYRNSSEDLFLKTLMENSAGTAAPTMEMLGFKNLNQTFRVDSEELFNSWLTNGENNGYSSTSIAHRTRQASRRMSTELTAFSSQQHGIAHQKKSTNDVSLPQNSSMVNELSTDHHQSSMRNAVEKGLQATNLYLAKAWFQSSQPMTRSRSSELRKRYAAMQNFQTSFGMEATQDQPGRAIIRMKHDLPTTSKLCDVTMSENHNQMETFMSPSNSSTSPFNTPMPTVDSISSVVSMLKGTLERKKLGNQIEKETIEGSSFGFYGSQEPPPYNSPGQVQNSIFEPQGTFQAISPIQLKDSANLQGLNGLVDVDIDGFVPPANPVQTSAISQEPSQSESSAAVLSTGFEVCDGPTSSGQTMSVCESSRKRVGNGSLEYGSKAKEFRERILDNKSQDGKKGGLARMGSATSGGSVEKADPTKKRRVERSRKMAEAKERNLTPAISSDMQSMLKRCENLEKEVRSLKLNLSFMNRKDSEQTKQIEELQKQNEELGDEKERLLEEIERILTETGKI